MGDVGVVTDIPKIANYAKVVTTRYEYYWCYMYPCLHTYYMFLEAEVRLFRTAPCPILSLIHI